MVWNMKYVSVTITGPTYAVLIYCKCTYTKYLMLNCIKDTTEKPDSIFVNDFLLVVLNDTLLDFSLSFIISYSPTCHKIRWFFAYVAIC